LYYLTSTLKGKTWYVVLLGQYRDKNAAKAALSKSPSSIRKMKPWIRTIKGLQDSASTH